MPNGTYGGVRGKETKVGQKTFVSRPTRLYASCCTYYWKLRNSYFEVLGEKATHKKLTEVNGDAVEEEVTISSSIVDGDKALEVLVECFC